MHRTVVAAAFAAVASLLALVAPERAAAQGIPLFPSAQYPSGAGPSGLVLLDLNADAKTDLLVSNRGSDNFTVRLGSGLGAFAAATSYATTFTLEAVRAGDLNGDAKLDVVTVNSFASDLNVRLGNGLGAFGAPVTLLAGLGPSFVRAADVTADGKVDLVVANGGAASVSILPGDGLGAFSAALNFVVGAQPAGLAVGDVNGDNRKDVLVANYNSSDATLLMNQSTAAYVLAYGSGCPGSGGFVPKLSATCCPAPGQTIQMTVEKGLGGATAILFFGLTQSAIPIPGPGGCVLRVSPVLPITITLPLFGAGAGNGAITFPATIPPSGISNATFTLQAFIPDLGTPQKYSGTNGIEMHIP